MVDNVGGMGAGGIRPEGPVGPKGPDGPKTTPDGKSFKDVLSDSISEVNELQKEADAVAEKFAVGDANITEVLGATRKAELAFDLLMEIRNKLVDAYEEISRMRI